MSIIYKVAHPPLEAVPTCVIQPTDYKVVTATTAALLTTAVKAQFTDGWCPWGGVMGISTTLYAQAMVKY